MTTAHTRGCARSGVRVVLLRLLAQHSPASHTPEASLRLGRIVVIAGGLHSPALELDVMPIERRASALQSFVRRVERVEIDFCRRRIPNGVLLESAGHEADAAEFRGSILTIRPDLVERLGVSDGKVRGARDAVKTVAEERDKLQIVLA